MAGDHRAVRDALAELDAAFERRDIGAVLDLCTEDVVFVGSADGEEAVGRDEVAAMFEALAPELEGLDLALQWESVDVDVLGDVALLSARGSARLTTRRRASTFRYRLTGVLIRTDDGWRWRVHHGSEPARW